MVGGLATLVDLAITTILFVVSSFNENIITTLAFISAFWVSYFGHRYFTFKSSGSVKAFFALAISTLILRNLIVYALVYVGIGGYISLILGMLIVTGITYFISKYKIFNHSGE